MRCRCAGPMSTCLRSLSLRVCVLVYVAFLVIGVCFSDRNLELLDWALHDGMDWTLQDPHQENTSSQSAQDPLLKNPMLLPVDFVGITQVSVVDSQGALQVLPEPGTNVQLQCAPDPGRVARTDCFSWMGNVSLSSPFKLDPYTPTVTPKPNKTKTSSPLSQASNQRRSVLLVPLPGQLMRNIFHAALNRVQGFSIILELSSRSGSTFYHNVDWIIYAYPWDGKVPSLVQLQSDRMAAFVAQQYNSTLCFYGLRHPIMPLTHTQLIMFRSSKRSDPTFDSTWTFLSSTGARLFRLAMLGALDRVEHHKHLELALWNRKPGVGRHVPNPFAIVESIESSVKALGYTVNVTVNDNFGAFGNTQMSVASSFDLVLTPHGQQGMNNIFMPSCGIFVELFGRGAYTPLYNRMALESGHVVGFVYNSTEAARCGHKGHVLYSTPAQSSRFCIKGSVPTNVDPQVVTDLVVNRLLPARDACLKRLDANAQTRIVPVVDYHSMWKDFVNDAPHDVF